MISSDPIDASKSAKLDSRPELENVLAIYGSFERYRLKLYLNSSNDIDVTTASSLILISFDDALAASASWLLY